MSSRGIKRVGATVILVLILVIGVFSFIERVPEGNVSVVYTPSGGATKTLDPGWSTIAPFHKTTQYPTKITIVDAQVNVTTNDGKAISMPVKYEIKVDSARVLDIFKELGSQSFEQVQEGYLYQNLFRAARNIVSQYSVLDIYGTKASEASAGVTEQMAETVGNLGFIVTNVTLGSPDLDEETQRAIDERVRASQELEKKKIEIETAEAEAERQRVEAEGVATAQIERARGEAESNKLISESITEELIDLREMDARLTHGWITVQGGTPIVDTKE